MIILRLLGRLKALTDSINRAPAHNQVSQSGRQRHRMV